MKSRRVGVEETHKPTLYFYTMIFNVGRQLTDYIFNNIDQEQAFAYYLGISMGDINYCLEDKSNKVSNPLREDKHPSLGFMYTSKGKLIMRDFAKPIYSGDIIDLVGILTNKNPNNRKEFVDIAEIIINNLIKDRDVTPSVKYLSINKQTPEQKKRKIIITPIRNWNKIDESYWKDTLHLPISYLEKEGVFPISTCTIVKDGVERIVYYYKASDPGYVYYFGKDGEDIELVQVYFPYRNKDKFITNHNMPFHLYREMLTDNEILLLTKSRKDKLVIDYHLNKNNVTVIPVNSESVRLTKDLVDLLKSKYKTIINNADYDEAGLLYGYYHYHLYNIPCIYLGRSTELIKSSNALNRIISKINGDIYKYTRKALILHDFYNYVEQHSGSYEVKDISDFITKYGKRKTKLLLNTIYNRCTYEG